MCFLDILLTLCVRLVCVSVFLVVVTHCVVFHCSQSSLCSEMASELRFALRCHGSTKPARKKGSGSGRGTASTDEERFHPLGPYAQYGFVGKEPLT